MGSRCLVNLGNRYHLGLDVTQDYVQAQMWYNLAKERGLKLSRENRDLLNKIMTPAQVSKAQKLAREWKPKGK